MSWLSKVYCRCRLRLSGPLRKVGCKTQSLSGNLTRSDEGQMTAALLALIAQALPGKERPME